MKNVFFLIFSSLILLSCEYKGFQNSTDEFCFPENVERVYKNNLMPISTGYKWVYKMKYDEDYLSELDEEEKNELEYDYTLEIGKTKNIYFKENGKKKTVLAYTIIQNGKESKYLYYVPCNEGTNFVEVNNYEELEIVAVLFIANNPQITSNYWNGVYKAKYDWLNKSSLDNPLEANNAIILQESLLNESLINPNDKRLKPEMIFYKTGKTWFKPGIGMIKREIFIDDKFIGILELESQDLEKLASPIEP